MKNRSWVFWAALFACALPAACATNTTSTVPVGPSAPAPPLPQNGVHFTYTTSEWGIFGETSATPQPIATATYTQHEVFSTGASFRGRTGLIEERYNGVYTPTGERQVWHGDVYLAWDPIAHGQRLDEIADVFDSSSTANAGGIVFTSADSGTTTFTANPLAEFPFVPGTSWNGASAYRSKSSGAATVGAASYKLGGSTDRHLDGSYTENDLNDIVGTFGSNGRSHVNVEADGSVQTSTTNGNSTFRASISAPERTANGTYLISLRNTDGTTSTIPDWYPGGGPPPSPLVRVTTADRGQATLPAACGVPASIATSGERIVKTVEDFNPLGNITTTNSSDYYTDGIGLVCDVSVSRSSLYNVTAPAAYVFARETYHMTTGLTSADPQSALSPTGLAAATSNARGASVLVFTAHHLETLREERRRLVHAAPAP
jgi:hypothetical protein